MSSRTKCSLWNSSRARLMRKMISKPCNCECELFQISCENNSKTNKLRRRTQMLTSFRKMSKMRQTSRKGSDVVKSVRNQLLEYIDV